MAHVVRAMMGFFLETPGVAVSRVLRDGLVGAMYQPQRAYTREDAYVCTFLYVLICYACYFVGRATVYRQLSLKRSTYIHAGVVATVCTLQGVYWYLEAFRRFPPSGLADVGPQLDRAMREPSWMGMHCTTYYAAYCIADLSMGLILYPKHMSVLEGWIHHTLYTWLMHWLTINVRGPGLYCCFLPLELPTALRAYGQLHPRLRSDFGFGLTFGLTRVALNAVLLVSIYLYCDVRTSWKIAALILSLHLYWFTLWVSKYGSKTFREPHALKPHSR